MRFFLDSDFKHWAVMPNSYNELRHDAICPECNKQMHPHYQDDPKSIGMTPRQMVEVRIVPAKEQTN